VGRALVKRHEVNSSLSEGWEKDLGNIIVGWPQIQVVSSMFFAFVFVGFSFLDTCNSMHSKYKNLSMGVQGLRFFWSIGFMTILPAYLMVPISSVKVLPEPADHIVLFRLPPESGLMLVGTTFLSILAFCMLCGTCFVASKGQNSDEACGPAYKYCMCCNLCVAMFFFVLAVLAFVYMGNFFFIDWKFKFSFDLKFVTAAMVAKLFLGAASVVDILSSVIENGQTLCEAKDEVKGQVDKVRM